MLLSRRRLFVVCQPAKQLFVLRFPAIQSAPSLTDGPPILVQNSSAIAKQGDNDNRKSMEDERDGTFCVDYCGFLLRIEGGMS
jgi:hypothetical protein